MFAVRMTGKRLPYLALSVSLGAVILAFLLAVNARYLFHTRLYEAGDLASNSLAVLRAGRFHELYGQYSRWGFRHPGPVVMYAFAWGEGLFYHALGLVPTPYNAQVITLMGLASGFLAGSIGVAARWVRAGMFVPLALLFAAAHFTSVDPNTWALCPWMPYVMTVPFFALLVGSASVGAGQGEDLPFLVLAGGFMLNTHVAQPLFVGPLCIVAYAGLAWMCHRSAEGSAPWRMFPRAHGFAGVLAVAFVLPMGVDLFRGSRSNAALILHHMHTHRGERHPWLDSAYCLLRFGAYKPSQPGNTVSPDNVTPGQIGHFLHDHILMTTLWVGALLVPPLALACRRWIKPRGAAYADHPPAPPGRWRFLGWLAAIWTLATALTLVWGHIQDGQMFYFNSWFTYGTYFALALLAAGAVGDIGELAVAHRRRPGLWTALAAVVCVAAAVGFLSHQVGRYHEANYDTEAARDGTRTVDAVLAARPDAPRTKLLIFEHDRWETVAAVAVLLAREGRPFVVPPDWRIVFGDEHAPADLFAGWKSGRGGQMPVDIWHIVAADTVDPAWAANYPLVQGCALLPGLPALDPVAADAVVTFGGAHHNGGSYVLDGWSQPDGDNPSAWNSGKTALIGFTPKPIPVDATVEADFYFAYPYLAGGKRDSQRVTLTFNRQDLGSWRIGNRTPSPLKVSIPAAAWNGQPTAVFGWKFPDGISPMEAGENLDERPLAIAGEKLVFHLVPAPAN